MNPYTDEFRKWYRAQFQREPDPGSSHDVPLSIAFEAGREIGHAEGERDEAARV